MKRLFVKLPWVITIAFFSTFPAFVQAGEESLKNLPEDHPQRTSIFVEECQTGLNAARKVVEDDEVANDEDLVDLVSCGAFIQGFLSAASIMSNAIQSYDQNSPLSCLDTRLTPRTDIGWASLVVEYADQFPELQSKNRGSFLLFILASEADCPNGVSDNAK